MKKRWPHLRRTLSENMVRKGREDLKKKKKKILYLILNQNLISKVALGMHNQGIVLLKVTGMVSFLFFIELCVLCHVTLLKMLFCQR